jgi:hypothetical protein
MMETKEEEKKSNFFENEKEKRFFVKLMAFWAWVFIVCNVLMVVEAGVAVSIPSLREESPLWNKMYWVVVENFPDRFSYNSLNDTDRTILLDRNCRNDVWPAFNFERDWDWRFTTPDEREVVQAYVISAAYLLIFPLLFLQLCRSIKGAYEGE